MIEKYFAGNRDLDPRCCYKLCPGDTDPDFDFATDLLDRDNIRWQETSRENGQKRLKFVLYREWKGLVLRTK